MHRVNKLKTSSLGYCLHCTSCNSDYDSEHEWHEHLAKPDHQVVARSECSETWGEDPEKKECTVVIFCSFTLTDGGTIPQVLKRFSRTGRYFVTDFVWFPGRPRIGYLQFESGKVITEIFKTLDGPSGYVENKLVQLRRTVDILQLEWQELFPPKIGNEYPFPFGQHRMLCTSTNGNAPESIENSDNPNNDIQTENPTNSTVTCAADRDSCTSYDASTSSQNAKPPIAADNVQSTTHNRSKTRLLYDEATGTVRMIREYTSPNQETATSPVNSVTTSEASSAQRAGTSKASADQRFLYSVIPIPKSSAFKNPQTSLQIQFNAICKCIEIPKDEFQFAINIVNVIKEIFTEDYPSGQVTLLRNFHLRLRTTGSNILLLYVYIADNPLDQVGFVPVTKAIQHQIFTHSKFKRFLPGFSKSSYDFCLNGGTPYQHRSTGFRFNFLTDPLSIGEAHLCLLVQYLCTFDSRVKPLLTLVYFWAKSHDVQIAEDNIPKTVYHSHCPEPTALDWLVMLFLTHEKVIPSVREILKRPHQPLVLCERRTDIAFSPDPEYAREWSRSRTQPDNNTDEFLVSVVTLAQKFFNFYSSNLKDGCWLLNPKDGEIIKREGTRCHKSKLTPADCDSVRL